MSLPGWRWSSPGPLGGKTTVLEGLVRSYGAQMIPSLSTRLLRTEEAERATW